MKIVIDIPDDKYKRIVKDGMTIFGYDADITMMEHVLENAIPLEYYCNKCISESFINAMAKVGGSGGNG